MKVALAPVTENPVAVVSLMPIVVVSDWVSLTVMLIVEVPVGIEIVPGVVADPVRLNVPV